MYRYSTVISKPHALIGGHFPGKSGSAGCSVDFSSVVSMEPFRINWAGLFYKTHKSTTN